MHQLFFIQNLNEVFQMTEEKFYEPKFLARQKDHRSIES